MDFVDDFPVWNCVMGGRVNVSSGKCFYPSIAGFHRRAGDATAFRTPDSRSLYSTVKHVAHSPHRRKGLHPSGLIPSRPVPTIVTGRL